MSNDENKEQKPFDHPDYRIGDSGINYTKWSRENEPKPEQKYRVGDVVTFTVTTKVTKVGSDCDGTTLYGLDMLGFGWSEDTICPYPDKDETE